MPHRTVRADVPDELSAIELVRVRIPLVTPFAAAHGTETDREVVLVHAVGADGVDGWGECVALSAPTYTAEWTAGAWRALADDLVPAVLAGRPVEVGDRPMAWTALEVALLDLRLRRTGTSLATHVGGTRSAVECGAVVGFGADPDAVVEAVAARVAAGAALVKLKVAPGRAVAVLRAVRHAFGSLPLAADANGSFAPGDLAELDELDDLGLRYVEQPVAPGPAHALVELSRRWATPVALDESVGDPAALDQLVEAGFAGIVNLKPGRVGGIGPSLALLHRCAAAGLGVFVGGMLETGVGRATALAVAAHPACALPTDLGPSSRYVTDDVTEPIELDGTGRLPVPSGPGLGVTPRPDRLAACTVDRLALPA